MIYLTKKNYHFLGFYFSFFFCISILLIPSMTSHGIDYYTGEIHEQQTISSDNTILLTGFGPFHIYAINPSQIIIETLNGTMRDNYSILSWVLPIDFQKAPEIMEELLLTYQPKLIIMLGLAPNATSIRLETLGAIRV